MERASLNRWVRFVSKRIGVWLIERFREGLLIATTFLMMARTSTESVSHEPLIEVLKGLVVIAFLAETLLFPTYLLTTLICRQLVNANRFWLYPLVTVLL